MSNGVTLSTIIQQHFDNVLDAWLAAQSSTRTAGLMPESELKSQCKEILEGIQNLTSYDPDTPYAVRIKDQLAEISRRRGLQGFSPTEVATFVFSIKDVMLPFLHDQLRDNPAQLAKETAGFNHMIDQFGLATFAAYAQSRDQYIRDQQKSILELSTPVVQVWENVLALPIVGSVDTARTQQMMESLLTKIVDTETSVVIIDITGVPIVDTAVARHLLQTISAARLLGAESILVGISARIAQTLVHIGVDLSSVITGTTLARGIELALNMTGRKIVKSE